MYSMPYHSSAYAGEILQAVLIGAVVFGLIIGLVFYLFQALGLYTISKRRGYKNAWLSFIPVVNAYVLGGIADNINFCTGKRTRYRVFLLIASIAYALVQSIMLIVLIQKLPEYIFMIETGSDRMVLHYMMQMMVFSMAGSLFSLIFVVLQAICLYKVYQDYAGNSAVIFLVLSILFGISPFFLFGLRNRPSASLYYRQQPPVAPVPPAPPAYPPAGPPQPPTM